MTHGPHRFLDAPRHHDDEGEATEAEIRAALLAAPNEAAYERVRGWPHRQSHMNTRVPEGGRSCDVEGHR